MKELLTLTQKEYLIEIAQGKFAEDITLLMNKKFDLQLTPTQIKAFKSRYGIKSNTNGPRTPAKLFTTEQEDFIRENNFNRTSFEIADMLKIKFGISITPGQIKNFRSRYKLPPCGLTGRFEKEHVPANKGVKSPGTGDQATIFQKGHIPKNHRPVGSIRICCDGYIYEKIAEPRKWKQKHVIVWESIHGPKPKNSAIIFLDKDKTNLDPNNLMCVKRNELVRINQNHLLYENAEISKAGVLIAKIMTKVGERKSKKRGGKRERE